MCVPVISFIHCFCSFLYFLKEKVRESRESTGKTIGLNISKAKIKKNKNKTHTIDTAIVAVPVN